MIEIMLRISEEQRESLRQIKEGVGIPISVQGRRAIALWIEEAIAMGYLKDS